MLRTQNGEHFLKISFLLNIGIEEKICKFKLGIKANLIELGPAQYTALVFLIQRIIQLVIWTQLSSALKYSGPLNWAAIFLKFQNLKYPNKLFLNNLAGPLTIY